jgi:hypothetical protein
MNIKHKPEQYITVVLSQPVLIAKDMAKWVLALKMRGLNVTRYKCLSRIIMYSVQDRSQCSTHRNTSI